MRMKTTCLLFLMISWATFTQGTGCAVLSSGASLLSKLENSSSGQRGFAAPLCGKPLAFRCNPSPLLPFRVVWKAEPSRRRGRGWLGLFRPGKAKPFRTASGEAAGRHSMA